ncbi:MAG: nuclear transport factor 2 family protein [Pseudomonadota bacterium]
MFDENLKRVADALIQNCRNNEEMKGLDELYAPTAVSIEAADMGGGNVVTEGVEAIKAKHDWWNSMMEVHDAKVEGPFLHGDKQFGAIFELDATQKDTGERMQFREMAVYTVDDGKIVREEFFFAG